ncbi:MAG TPA: hypothetical protein VG247_24490 [Pseudonocardiaceae bacterium]|jgi:hypothetical protein|nr:hypothetical protein [Pseudonocardiaceae bacterium]
MITQAARLFTVSAVTGALVFGGAITAQASPASAHPDGTAAPATFVADATEVTVSGCKSWLSADNSSGHWYVDFHVESWGNIGCAGSMQRSTDSGRHWTDFGDTHAVADGAKYDDPDWYYDGVNTSNGLTYEMRVGVCNSNGVCKFWSAGY